MSDLSTPEAFAHALRQCLEAPDPDAALIAFKDEVLQAADLIGTQAHVDLRGKAPISGFAAVMLARAYLRAGRLDLMTAFLEQFALRWTLHPAPEALADAPWLEARVSSMRVLTEPEDALQYLRIAYPCLHLELIAAAAVRRDQDELVRLILAFASYRRQKNDARSQDPLVAELADLPAAAAYGPFRFDPATILDRQEEALRLGPMDWLLEHIQAFEALLLENALLSEQPARGLPLIDVRLEALLTGPVGDDHHFVFNAICILSTLGQLERALDAARRLVRRGYGLPWRFRTDRADVRPSDWTRQMRQDEWLAPLHALPAYESFLDEEIRPPRALPPGPAATPPCAVHDGELGGKAAKKCFVSGVKMAPGTPIVRLRRLRGISAEDDFDIADQAAFAASEWQAARTALETCTMPVSWLFPHPRGQQGSWDSPLIAEFCADVARDPGALDVERAVTLLATFEPPPMRFLWAPARYQWHEPFAPFVGDDMHGDAARFTWRLLRTGQGPEMLRIIATLPHPQADKVLALLATFDIPEIRTAAATHFGLPDLPEIMELVFAPRLSFEDHLRLADFGTAHPRFRAGMVAAMCAYALHLYSNTHITADWFLQGLEDYAYAHGCQLLFLLIHHPQDDPVLAKVLETGWLPRSSNTYDGYGNAAPFYLRTAMIHIALHHPEQLDDWVDSERLRAMSTMAKDRETFRLLEAYRKKRAKRGNRRKAEG